MCAVLLEGKCYQDARKHDCTDNTCATQGLVTTGNQGESKLEPEFIQSISKPGAH